MGMNGSRKVRRMGGGGKAPFRYKVIAGLAAIPGIVAAIVVRYLIVTYTSGWILKFVNLFFFMTLIIVGAIFELIAAKISK